ncbi:MAG: hypothetical protein E6J78_13705 [Deltaproteobacteria bacterium]|nr:MAG: hypothetical protein E6J78_13705 [Deltaproteobacteria bacterium]
MDKELLLKTFVLILGLAFSAAAADKCKEPPELKAKAQVTCGQARKAALARVKAAGRVQDAELEEDQGKLVYSFDIRRKGASGVEEVQVDAQSGAVTSVKHESAKDEAAEAKIDQSGKR